MEVAEWLLLHHLVFFPLFFFSPFELSLSPIKVFLDKFSHFYFFIFSLLVEVGTGGREQLCRRCSGLTHISKHIGPCKGQSFSCLGSTWNVERWKKMEEYFVSLEMWMDPRATVLSGTMDHSSLSICSPVFKKDLGVWSL